MDDPLNTPDSIPSEEPFDTGVPPEATPFAEPLLDLTPAFEPQLKSPEDRHADVIAMYADAAERKRGFRNNLLLLLGLTLAAFILSSWILVRVDSPFGIFSSGPQEVVRAQLRALDHGELRPAYDMFSPRYRGQVSFDTWHELFITHWRMFHADVVRSEIPAQSTSGVTLEIYLHSADDKDYRARFTLVRADGRWWIDDVHWEQEPDERELSRT
ncbi:MAG TPA: hypothetical protein VG272_03205 [Candidatus Acidoferrales bacterium]|jgi:hypothetical protein|nr:hypothetical protein [Candidatus Acidoferrales bacterium]